MNNFGNRVNELLSAWNGKQVFVQFHQGSFPVTFTFRGVLVLSKTGVGGWTLRAQEPTDQIRLLALNLHLFSQVDTVEHAELGPAITFQNQAQPAHGLTFSSLKIMSKDPIQFADFLSPDY